MTHASFDRAILGGGPVGLALAIRASKRSPTLLLIDGEAAGEAPPRLETVPAPFISLLIELGVHPARVGIDKLHTMRLVAWETATADPVRSRAVAHVEHGALQAELLALARRAPGLTVANGPSRPERRRGSWVGDSWRALQLFDASGRAMALADRRIRPPRPWVARPFWVSTTVAATDRSLRIAALPFGYAYRLANWRFDMVWVAGRDASLAQTPAALEQTLVDAGAAWLLTGFGPLAAAESGRAYPASVAWAEHSGAWAIGDAAFARDILGSQGLSAGISDALYACAVDTDADVALWRERQHTERAVHLKSLTAALAASRFRDRPAWLHYRAFVESHERDGVRSDVALVDGRVARRPARIPA